MTKKQFMDELKKALEGNVSYDTYKSNVEYYENYFDTRKRNGMTEEEIAASLGSGRVIAKTIIDAERKNQGGSNVHYDNYDEEKRTERWSKILSNPALRVSIGALIFIVAIAVIISLVIFSLQVIWKVIVPLILIAIVVFMIIFLVSYLSGR